MTSVRLLASAAVALGCTYPAAAVADDQQQDVLCTADNFESCEPEAQLSLLRRFSLAATDQVERRLVIDALPGDPLIKWPDNTDWGAWKDSIEEEYGLNWSFDYINAYMHASESPGDETGFGGALRFSGLWELSGDDAGNSGALIWKVEHRHKYSDIPPSALGFESGYAGIFEPPFSNQSNRLTNLYWKQYFAGGTWAAVAGFLDVTDFVDVYLLASPWTGFNNFVFSTGSASMDLPNDATLGAAAGGMIGKSLYVQAGIADANSDPTDPFDGFDSDRQQTGQAAVIQQGGGPGRPQQLQPRQCAHAPTGDHHASATGQRVKGAPEAHERPKGERQHRPVRAVADGIGYRHLDQGYREGKLGQLFVMDLANGEARRLVDQGGVSLNNERVEGSDQVVTTADLVGATTLVIRVGKKRYFLARFV